MRPLRRSCHEYPKCVLVFRLHELSEQFGIAAVVVANGVHNLPQKLVESVGRLGSSCRIESSCHTPLHQPEVTTDNRAPPNSRERAEVRVK